MSTKDANFDPLVDEAPSRFVVGIDLGTTNSAVTYVDTLQSPWQIRVFSIPQLTAPGQVEERETLPSFHFQPASGSVTAGGLRLPWSTDDPREAVGTIAREEGLKTPGRLVASAKSWLCHSGVDRKAALLPWHGAEDVEKYSPVEISAQYLRHLRDAWNARFPQEQLAAQDIVLTLPASFDEVARELTVEAASRAELPRVMLIEEPQAAFYAWVYKHADAWEDLVAPGQKILVCDVGGGTSDFTLIRVRRSEASDDEQNRVQFHRVAVGNHLILGGDNLDLSLARHLEQKIGGSEKLSPRQWDVLLCTCRRVKETLLSDEAPDEMTLNLPSGGSKLIGGGLQIKVTRQEVQELLVDGFLPQTKLDEKPTGSRVGFQEFGLPYAADPAITRHLASFLTAHRQVALSADETDSAQDHDPARPDVILFNGGFFASAQLRERIQRAVRDWFSPQERDWSPMILDNDRLDMAVARGAAYYGMVRRGDGVRIAATLARSYYVVVDDNPPTAVCLVPGDAEPGQLVASPEQTFQLTISQPVEFPLLVSSTRLTDRPGDLVEVDAQQMTALPPIRTVLRTQRRSETGALTVRLHAQLTEIGTIDLWCSEVGSERSWRLQFDVRATTQTDQEWHAGTGEQEGFVDESSWQACQQMIESVFSAEGQDKPAGLPKRLAKTLQMDRTQWPTSLLRRMWETLMGLEPGRRRSAAHEARWLNLLGFCLRPGFGLAVDDWRVAETWRIVRGKLAHHGSTSRNESLILWRRIAGGLTAGQQLAISEPLLATLRGFHQRFVSGKGGMQLTPAESVEIWRLIGSLELLNGSTKVELGRIIVALLPRKKLASIRGPLVWTLGRLGQRVPVYGPLNTVVGQTETSAWLACLMSHADEDSVSQLAAMQLARRTQDRHRDLPDEVRERVAGWLSRHRAAEHLAELVLEGGSLKAEEQDRVFGESLPRGLKLN